MSYNDDMKAIEDEIRSLVRTYDPATENEYEPRASRMIDKWKERGYDIYNADVSLQRGPDGNPVGVKMTVSVHDMREGGIYDLEVEW